MMALRATDPWSVLCIFALALILSPIEFVHKRVGFFLYRCYFVTNSKYSLTGGLINKLVEIERELIHESGR
jgi:hypothetical protein